MSCLFLPSALTFLVRAQYVFNLNVLNEPVHCCLTDANSFSYLSLLLLCELMQTETLQPPPKPPNWGGPRPTLGALVSLKLLFGYVTIFSSADLFTTDLNCRKKLACDIISECNVILSRRI